MTYRRWPGARGQPTLLMLHGLASNSTRWCELAELLAGEFAAELVCPDLRGHGGSVYRGRLRSEDWVGDLVGLLDHLECPRVVAGGHCLGANIALRLALARPERVSALILIEPMLPGTLKWPLSILSRVRGLLRVAAWPVRMLNALGIHRRNLPNLDLSELDRASRGAVRDQGDERAILARYSRPGADTAYMPVATYLQALAEVLRGPGRLAATSQPALALLSRGGLLMDPERSHARLQALPEVRIEWLPALHWIPTEAPEAMSDSIRSFLDSLGSARQEAGARP